MFLWYLSFSKLVDRRHSYHMPKRILQDPNALQWEGEKNCSSLNALTSPIHHHPCKFPPLHWPYHQGQHPRVEPSLSGQTISSSVARIKWWKTLSEKTGWSSGEGSCLRAWALEEYSSVSLRDGSEHKSKCFCIIVVILHIWNKVFKRIWDLQTIWNFLSAYFV